MSGKAKVYVSTEIENPLSRQAGCKLYSVIKDDKGNTMGQSTNPGLRIPGFQKTSVQQEILVKDPKLWSLESPTLYTLVSFILSENKIYLISNGNINLNDQKFVENLSRVGLVGGQCRGTDCDPGPQGH